VITVIRPYSIAIAQIPLVVSRHYTTITRCASRDVTCCVVLCRARCAVL